jgi:hypothetical protein
MHGHIRCMVTALANPLHVQGKAAGGVYVAPHTSGTGVAAEKKEAPGFVQNPNAAAMKSKVALPRQVCMSVCVCLCASV